MTLVIPLLLGSVAIFIIGYTLWAFLSPLIGNPRDILPRLLLKRKESGFAQIDELLGTEDYDKAIPLLRDSFYLSPRCPSVAVADKINALNMSVLSRLVSIAEKRGSHLPSLALVEELLLSRAQVLLDLLEASASMRRASRKSMSKGKKLPSWAANEIKTKISEAEDRALTNKKSLDSKLDQLFAELRSIAGEADVTYH